MRVDRRLNSSVYLGVLAALFSGIYLGSDLHNFAWESYLWPLAIEGVVSASHLYQAIHPERLALPAFTNLYHPNHPLTHLFVALVWRLAPSESALTVWRHMSTAAGIAFVCLCYLALRQMQVSPRRAALAAAAVGVSNAVWYEAVSADVHIGALAALALMFCLSLRPRLAGDGGSDISRGGAALLAASYVLAVGLHLHAAPAAALLGAWLLWRQRRRPQTQTRLRAAFFAGVVTLFGVYFLPFAAAGLPVFTPAGFKATYLLNPGHHAGAAAAGFGDASWLALGGLARALVPGYSPSAQLTQALVLGSLFICLGLGGRRLWRAPGSTLLLLLLAVYFIWIAFVIGQPNSVVYWLYVAWLPLLAATVIVDQSRLGFAADAILIAWILTLGASTFSREIQPKMAIAANDVAFVSPMVADLSEFDNVIVSIADPNQMLPELWRLARTLPPEKLSSYFWTTAGAPPRFDWRSQGRRLAVVSVDGNDRLLQQARRSGCFNERQLWSRTDALPIGAFRFSTDWRMLRGETYVKRIVVTSLERQISPACEFSR